MNGPEPYVNGGLLQVAKRELQGTVSSAQFWLGLVCVVVVLTVAAPFDSGEEFTAFQRFAYWGAIAPTTYLAAAATAAPLLEGLLQRGWNLWLATIVSGIFSGIPAGVIVYLVNTQIAGNDDGGLDDLVRIIGYCAVIAPGVMILRQMIVSSRQEPAAVAVDHKLMARLKPEARGRVLTLQAQDHYVEVTTSRGSDLLLMRLADAIAELGAVDGQQTHRSWWVARDAVSGQIRDGAQMVLELSDGRRVPVSRANERAVRDWLTGALAPSARTR